MAACSHRITAATTNLEARRGIPLGEGGRGVSLYYADRAQQCRKWVTDLQEGHRADLTDIAGGLREFEALAL
jgi:hypothetical protein